MQIFSIQVGKSAANKAARLSVALAVLAFASLAGAQNVTKVSLSPASVAGGASSTGTITLSKKAGAEGADVMMDSSNQAASVPQNVHVPAGGTSATFTITTTPVGSNATAKIDAMLGQSMASANLTIKAPALTGFTISPSSVIGCQTATGTLTLGSAAPSGGLQVKISCTSNCASVDGNPTVPEGSKTKTFTISTSAVANKTVVKITAGSGASSIGVSLTVNSPTLAGVQLDKTSVTGGGTATGTLYINGIAPNGGTVINVSSDQKSVSVPSTVKVAANGATATFAITTKAVTTKTVATITAKLGTGTATAKLTVNPTSGSKFVGTFKGTYYSTKQGMFNDLGGVSLVVATDGTITGSAVDTVYGGTSTVAGKMTTAGVATITVTTNGKAKTNTATFTFNSANVMSASFTNDGQDTVVTLNKVANPFMFTGKWSGTYDATGNGGDTGTVSITVSAAGVISGTATSSSDGSVSTLAGTIDATGVVTLTVSRPGHSDSNAGGGGFDESGTLNIAVMGSGQQVPTIIMLAPSQAP